MPKTDTPLILIVNTIVIVIVIIVYTEQLQARNIEEEIWGQQWRYPTSQLGMNHWSAVEEAILVCSRQISTHEHHDVHQHLLLCVTIHH